MITITPNMIIQNYKFLKKIGSGGMGDVFEAKDITLKRKVAIKMLNPALLTSNIIVNRFKEEAKILAALNHDNIVKVFSFFESNNNFFMVMEFIQGSTLKETISEKGLIPENKSVPIILQILDALDYVHNKGIIHRDIKSSNIMLTQSGVAKLMDFGIAKQLSEEFSKDGNLTATMTQMGTVFYMSPEQIKSTKSVDKRTDIFSLGITFFELLTARLPYDIKEKGDFDIQEQIVHSLLPDPRIFYKHISDKNIAILKKMTEKDREHRYKNCDEVKNALLSTKPIIYPTYNPNYKEPKRRYFKKVFILTVLIAISIISYQNHDYIYNYIKNIFGESPTKKDTAIASKDIILELKDQFEIKPNNPADADIYSAAFSNGLNYLAIGDNTGILEIHDLKNRLLKNYYVFDNSPIWSLHFTNYDQVILAGMLDGNIYSYYMTNEYANLTKSNIHPVYSLTTLSTNNITYSQLNSLYNNSGENDIYQMSDSISAIACFDKQDIIAIADESGNIVITDLNNGNQDSTNIGEEILSIDFFDSKRIIVGTKNSVEIWDFNNEPPNLLIGQKNTSKYGQVKAMKYNSQNNLLWLFLSDNGNNRYYIFILNTKGNK